jgi:mRNA interferase RelE/StbE
MSLRCQRAARSHLHEAGRFRVWFNAAAWELIQGDDKPQIVGKPLMEPYAGDWSARRGTYRIRYRFDDKTLTVLAIKPRSTAYQA